MTLNLNCVISPNSVFWGLSRKSGRRNIRYSQKNLGFSALDVSLKLHSLGYISLAECRCTTFT